MSAQVAAVPSFLETYPPPVMPSPAPQQGATSSTATQHAARQGRGFLRQPFRPQFQSPEVVVTSWEQATSPAAVSSLQQQQQQQVEQQQNLPVQAALGQCRSWQAAARVIQSHPSPLSFDDVTSALKLLSTALQPRALSLRQRAQFDSLLSSLAVALQAHLLSTNAETLAASLAALLQLGYVPRPRWMRAVLQHAATDLSSYTPAGLVVLITAASRAAAAQQAARAAASSSSGGGGSTGRDRVTSSSGTSTSTPAVAAAASTVPSLVGTVGLIAASSSGGTSHFYQQQQQESSAFSESSSTAARDPPVVTSAWVTHFMTSFEKFLSGRSAHPDLQPQHMEALITSLASLGARPDPSWLYLYARQLLAQMGDCPPAALVIMTSALGHMGYKLPSHLLLQFERRVGAALLELRPTELTAALGVFASVRQKPSEAWVQQLLGQVLKGSSHLSANAVVGLMVGAAAVGYNMDHAWIDLLLLQARHLLMTLAPHEHVGLMDALSHQHYRPSPGFMSEYMGSIQQRLPELSLEQITLLLAGLAQVGYKPAPQWMRTTMLQLLQRPTTGSDYQTVLRLLGALKKMQYTPSADIMAGLEKQIDGMAMGLLLGQVQQLREGLAALEYVPYVPAAAAHAAAAAAGADAGDAAEEEVVAVAGVAETGGIEAVGTAVEPEVIVGEDVAGAGVNL